MLPSTPTIMTANMSGTGLTFFLSMSQKHSSVSASGSMLGIMPSSVSYSETTVSPAE